MSVARRRWYGDREAFAFIAMRYLPWFAVLNLAWEIAQLPLYTIWSEGARAEIAFAVFHCTLGDILVGVAALALALMLTGARALADWHWCRITPLLVILGVGYTVFSEWQNATLFRWTYSGLMPTLDLAGFKLGLSPLLQWIVLPPLALHLARRRQARA